MVLVLVGPTAVGKTEVALRLAERLQAEIVSADSMQVYRGMDIGTAKPTPAERQLVPHHLIDLVDPGVPFSVAQYVQLADQALAQIQTRGRLAILTGGTAFYVQAVIDGLPAGATAPPNPELRRQLLLEAECLGTEALHQRLAQVDPESAARLHPHDRRRIIRALEIYLQTGRPRSCEGAATWARDVDASAPASDSALSQGRSTRPATPATSGRYNACWFGLTRPRRSLYERIAQRVHLQLEAGLVDEVRRLLQQGWDPDATSQQALGYKEMVAYLRGRLTLAEATELLIRSTRHYAKRQLSWWRRDSRIRWLDLDRWSVDQAVAWISRAFLAEAAPGVDLASLISPVPTSPDTRSPFLATPDVDERTTSPEW
ncbi:MAG: tRNA (adenosine(37)-N6)-dimethylallyltransferase MiaA [Limnochordaceae bacterium]|nr:tRNA (adenosine(37)-N6)-dimethylallyltransferase MiaA [Limnochordaceae bacterium]